MTDNIEVPIKLIKSGDIEARHRLATQAENAETA